MKTDEVDTQQLLVDGTWTQAADGRLYEQTFPLTGERVGHAAAAARSDAARAVEAADRAFSGWAAAPARERQRVLNDAADLLEERGSQIAQTMTEETGAIFGWGMFNAALAAAHLRGAATQADSVGSEKIVSEVPGKRAMGVRQACGVVVGIAPWNAPLILAARAVAAPLAFGNTVVLKASELSPRTHAHVARALQDAGAPDGAVNLITNTPQDAADVVDELIAHPKTRRVNFTGSSRVGAIIAANAGRHLKRVLLELGGKAPMLILNDADLDGAVKAAAFGAFFHQGQICMSTERIVIERGAADAFSSKLTERAAGLVVGDPRDQQTQIGPMINAASVKHVTELVADAVTKGAQLLTGGEADGPLFPPTVIRGVTKEMRLYSEESFGPLVAIIEVDGADDAVTVANDSDYGLAAAVWSSDVSAAMDLASRIESGICHVNDTTVQDEPQMPFGGVKASGFGRFGGTAALEEFTELRWITVQEAPREFPI